MPPKFVLVLKQLQKNKIVLKDRPNITEFKWERYLGSMTVSRNQTVFNSLYLQF